MNDWENLYQQEGDAIKKERESYQAKKFFAVQKFFDCLSFVFLACGYVALGLVFFTEITLIQATCLFVISYVIQPTDGDRYESQMKGIAEDLANIRINSTIVSKDIKNKRG